MKGYVCEDTNNILWIHWINPMATIGAAETAAGTMDADDPISMIC
jgi:hypothetical protein